MKGTSRDSARQRLRAVGEQASEALPPRQVRCRAGRHHFPLDDWLPPAPVPAGVSVHFASEGRYKLVERCLACKAVTGVTYTHPGGEVDGFLRRQLVYDGDWVKLAQGVPRGRAAMRDVAWTRGREQMAAFIGQAVTTLLEDDREPVRPPVPPVVLRSV